MATTIEKIEKLETPQGRGKHAELAEVLEAHQGEHHIIVLQDYPDPDAISSALAHQIISGQYDIETDIVYGRKISHQQNRAMVRLLGIDVLHYEETLKLEKYDGAVVDHHQPQEELQAEFTDIRRTYGATASIFSEYSENGLLEMDKGNRDHVMLATALTHGILTDTVGFVRARREDFHAAAFLSSFRDADLLEQIMTQARSRQTMEIIHQDLENRQTTENFSLAGIGYLRAEDRDAIPQAADFLLTEENVHTAIVYGIVTGEEWDETLVGSMRTSKLTMVPDEFIKDVFGKDAAGHYFGGGKLSAGGFEIPIGFLAGGHDDDYEDFKWKAYDKQIKQRVFPKIGIDQNSDQ